MPETFDLVRSARPTPAPERPVEAPPGLPA
jgi:hypothetical protein